MLCNKYVFTILSRAFCYILLCAVCINAILHYTHCRTNHSQLLPSVSSSLPLSVVRLSLLQVCECVQICVQLRAGCCFCCCIMYRFESFEHFVHSFDRLRLTSFISCMCGTFALSLSFSFSFLHCDPFVEFKAAVYSPHPGANNSFENNKISIPFSQ